MTIKSLKPALTYTITAQPTDSVLDLKALVTAASSSSSSAGNTVAVESQRLLLKGKALADNKLLKEYDLKSGAIVHLILKTTPAAGTMTSAAGLAATVPSPSAPSSSLNPASGAVPDLGSASTAQQSKSSSIDLPRPSMGHARVPSLTITAEAPGSSPGSSSPGREIPLNLTDAPPLGPQAQVSSASFHQTIANPDFWQKVHELCVQEFPNEVDADQAWEAFLLSVKGRLSAGEAAKIRDVVGVRGMCSVICMRSCNYGARCNVDGGCNWLWRKTSQAPGGGAASPIWEQRESCDELRGPNRTDPVGMGGA